MGILEGIGLVHQEVVIDHPGAHRMLTCSKDLQKLVLQEGSL